MLKTRYIDAGPALPQASMQAALVTGEAHARMGQTIAAVGEKGLQIAQRVREAEEAGIMSAYFAKIDEEAGQFSNSLLTRSDYQNWPTDWRQKVDSFRGEAGNLNLSPVAKQALGNKMTEWSTQRTIRMEALAANRIVDESRATIQINAGQAAARGDYEAFQTHLSALPGLGVSPSEIKRLEIEGTRLMARQELSQDAATDPFTIEERLADPDFLKQPGNENLTMEDLEWAKNEAKQQQRIAIGGATDTFHDGLATGDIRTTDDIDRKFGTINPETGEVSHTLPPRVIAAFKSSLQERNSEAFKLRAQSPEYRDAVITKVELALQDLPLEIGKFPEKQVEIEMMIDTLPTGATKTRLKERAQEVRDGKIKEFQSAADIARDDFVTLYKNNQFGGIEDEVNIPAILDQGFLRNRKTLLADGYSQEQADLIAGKAFNEDPLKASGFTPEEIDRMKKSFDAGTFKQYQQDLFRALRNKRPRESNLTGYQKEITEAIVEGKTSYTRVDQDKLTPAQRNLAGALSEFEKWINANPDKVNDSQAIDKKRFEIIDRTVIQGADNLFLNPSVLPPKNPTAPFDPSTSSIAPITFPQIDNGPKGASELISTAPVGNNIKDMVKHFEAGGEKAGFHAKAYDDGKQHSIGYGTKAKPGEVITKEEAERRLDAELSSHRARVEKEAAKAGLSLAPHELDALTSFDFNTGSIEKLLAGGTRSKQEIAEKMLLYTKADGKTLRGLENRRKAESALFRNGY